MKAGNEGRLRDYFLFDIFFEDSYHWKRKKKNPNLYISIHLDKRGFEMRGYLIHICWYFMIFYLKDNFKIPVAPAFKCTHIQMRS